MNTEQKREAIRIKVCEVIPDILETKNGCLIKGGRFVWEGSIHDECDIVGFLGLDRDDIIGRPILAQDILRALRADIELAHIDCLGRLYRHDIYICEIDLSQNLSEWSSETIDKLYELLIPEENLDEKRLSKEYFNKF